jgi:hypothetical protein
LVLSVRRLFISQAMSRLYLLISKLIGETKKLSTEECGEEESIDGGHVVLARLITVVLVLSVGRTGTDDRYCSNGHETRVTDED